MAMKSVLVVEDDPLNAHLLSLYLRAHGYRPYVARDGVAGVESFEKNQQDLVLIDVQLPRKMGSRCASTSNAPRPAETRRSC